MDEWMQDLIKQKQLQLGVALALNQIDDDKVRYQWTMSAVRDGMTVRAASDALREYQKLKEMRETAPPGEFAPAIPMAPPIILFPCVKCGNMATSPELRYVQIHAVDCQPG